MGRCLHTWLCFMLSAAAWLGAAVSSVPAADATHSDDDGLGRLIRTQSPWPNPEAQGNLVRSERFFYDGIRRIQELVTDPVSNLASASVSTSAPVQQAANQALEGPEELDPSAAPGSVEAAQGVEATAITVSTLAREYVWGPGDNGIDELFTQFDQSGKPWWTLQDSGGDIVALVEVPNATVPPSSSNAARVAAQWTYDAYGSVLSAEHLYPHPLMHCGHKAMFFDRLDVGVVDLTSNSELPRLIPFAHTLYHNRNRVYNPQIGRFMQQDPNATAMSLIEGSHSGRGAGAVALAFSTEERYGDGYNLYQYLGSNPWNRSDPMGLSSDPFDMVDEYLAEEAGSRAAFMASMGRQAVSLAILAAQITTYLPFPAANVAGELALAMMGEQSMEAASMAIAIGFIPGGKIMSGAGKALKAVGRFAARAAGAVWRGAVAVAGKMGSGLWRAGSAVMERAAKWLAKGCGCFEAETTVWTRDGLVPIESIREGDEVLATDEVSGESSWRSVVRTFVRQGAPIVAVTIAASSSPAFSEIGGAVKADSASMVVLNTTEDHPFLVNGCEWIEAGNLKPGAKLSAERGGDTEVISVQFTGRLADVYNFEVEGLHNYRVGIAGLGVHNGLDCNLWEFGKGMANHVLQSKHNWDQVVGANPAWDQVKELLAKAANEGVAGMPQAIYNGKGVQIGVQIEKIIMVNGREVVAKLSNMNDLGKWILKDGWVK